MASGAPSEHVTDLRTIMAGQLAVYACGDPHDVPESLWKDIKALFSEREIVELVFMIGYYSGNQIMNILWNTERNPEPAIAGDGRR
jgi:hypothetical protein